MTNKVQPCKDTDVLSTQSNAALFLTSCIHMTKFIIHVVVWSLLCCQLLPLVSYCH